MHTPILIIAGIIALLTWAVSKTVLKGNAMLGNPLIALAVGGLAFIGLLSLSKGAMNGIVLLYAAMAIAILLILAFGWLTGHRFGGPRNDGNTPPDGGDSHSPRKPKNPDNMKGKGQ